MKKLTEEFNKATVAKGDIFSIALSSSASAGYRWDLQLKAGKASLVHEGYVSDAPPGSMICGGGGKQIFVYKADEAGVIDIEASYKRPWEKRPPVKSQTFSITVK